MKSFLQRHSLLVGALLMFLCTWTIDLSNSGVLPLRIPFAVVLTLGWGFFVVSVGMTWATLGQAAAATFIKRVLIWRVGWRWWLAALLLLPGLQLAAVLLTAWLTGLPADFSAPMIRAVVPLDASLLALAAPWLIFEILTNGEEWGWRGYILPRLQAKHSALVSSLIVGLLWSLWHLPKFLGTGLNSDRSFLWFTVALLALSILYTWLYNNTRGSILLVMLFHATQNTAGMFLPVKFAAAGGLEQNVLVLLIVAAAVAVLVAAGAQNLSRTAERQMQDPACPSRSANGTGSGLQPGLADGSGVRGPA